VKVAVTTATLCAHEVYIHVWLEFRSSLHVARVTEDEGTMSEDEGTEDIGTMECSLCEIGPLQEWWVQDFAAQDDWPAQTLIVCLPCKAYYENHGKLIVCLQAWKTYMSIGHAKPCRKGKGKGGNADDDGNGKGGYDDAKGKGGNAKGKDDVPADVIEHFKYKCNDNYGHLDYRPPEIMDDIPGTIEAWETYKDKTRGKGGYYDGKGKGGNAKGKDDDGGNERPTTEVPSKADVMRYKMRGQCAKCKLYINADEQGVMLHHPRGWCEYCAKVLD
jgi:hypothetical protein